MYVLIYGLGTHLLIIFIIAQKYLGTCGWVHNGWSVTCYCFMCEHFSEGQRWRLLAWPFLGDKFSQYKGSTMNKNIKIIIKINIVTLKILISPQNIDFLNKFSTNQIWVKLVESFSKDISLVSMLIKTSAMPSYLHHCV